MSTNQVTINLHHNYVNSHHGMISVLNLNCSSVILKELHLELYTRPPTTPIYQDTSCLPHYTVVYLDLVNVNLNSINIIILYSPFKEVYLVHNFWVQILRGRQQLEQSSLGPISIIHGSGRALKNGKGLGTLIT